MEFMIKRRMMAISINAQKKGEEKYPESLANISKAMIVKPIVVAIYIEIGVLVFMTYNFNDYSTLAVWICVVLMSVPNL
jgi:hypothetical protein